MKFFKIWQKLTFTFLMIILSKTVGASPFDINAIHKKLEPEVEVWKNFFKQNAESKEKIWLEHQKSSSPHLKAWHWTWRLAWVKSCQNNLSSWCSALMKEGLKDRALAVRVETTKVLGKTYEGKPTDKILRLLIDQYRDRVSSKNPSEKNSILYALKTIGGDKAMIEARSLAFLDKKTKAYWIALNSSSLQ
ncbi:MAG: hypothetical protein KA436_03085 [Oligoflexales bacterium]|nr:hypothetical protein [Oligoflexales bacterium]